MSKSNNLSSKNLKSQPTLKQLEQYQTLLSHLTEVNEMHDSEKKVLEAKIETLTWLIYLFLK